MRSNLKSFAARRRRCLETLRLGAELEDSDAVGGPVGEEGLPDDPVAGDGAPESAVVTCSTVVAHHEVMVRRNLDLFRQIAGSSGAARPDLPVALDRLAVHDRDSVLDAQAVAADGDDALDEVGVGLLGRCLRTGL